MNFNFVKHRQSRWRLTPFKIAAIYVLVSGLWILFSDRLLATFAGDPATLTRLQTFKGWFFIVVTGGMLFALIRRNAATLVRSETAQQERTKTEKALRESEGMFQALLESAAEAIVVINREGRIVLVNVKAEEIFGYHRDELIGQTVELLLPEPLRQTHVKHRVNYLANLRTRPMGIGYDLAARRKDRNEFPVEISLSYVNTEDGVLVMSCITDITARVKAERALVEREEQRRKLEEQFRQSQKMDAIGKLAGGVAHDFNNLLSAIVLYSEMLLDDLPIDNPMREHLEEIMKVIDRSGALTRQLMLFSRTQPMQAKVLNLNTIVADMEKMLHRLIGEDIELTTALASELGRVKVDSGHLEQVIMNLVVNARDAMPNGGKLTVETANVELDETYAQQHLDVTPGAYVMLSVSDNGSGMDAETQSHIFEPFFTTKPAGKGTGLGLATVYGIVKQYGGNVWVYSEPGHGTTFKIYFPREDEAGEVAKREPISIKAFRGSETILLVEDEDVVRNLARLVLEQAGYMVLEARHGEEALQIFERRDGPIHLMVTDVVMPKLGGGELAERVALLHPEMKVIFMSAYTDKTIVHHGVATPVMAFLQKPFTKNALLLKVREVLDAS